ncbi:MAG: ATP/GTP-binding protein [Candidatus Korarchaeota archaeon]|nr:ATP/GTP-binding protein [Candidatus Korarchaeota archaeon]
MTTDVALVMGLAGTGKTTLTGALVRWMKKRGLRASAVNLDPGVRRIPYEPAYDVRELVTVEDVMEREGLGPNGAILRAIDILAEDKNLERLVSGLESVDADFMVVDTPGQAEAFALRASGRRIVDAISDRFSRTTAIFLGEVESNVMVEDFLTAALLAKIIELKLDVGVIPALNKADLGGGERLKEIWTSVLRGETRDLILEGGGVASEALSELLEAVKEFRTAQRVALISAREERGLDELFDMLVEVWCACGDMT